MNTVSKITSLLLLFLLSGNACLRAQRFDYNDKLLFADSVRNIKVWTYIEGDSLYRRYHDAVVSITDALKNKGYSVEFVEYEPGKGVSPQAWMQKIISGLKKNEAFLETGTRVKMNQNTDPARPNTNAIISYTGRVELSINRPYLSDSVLNNYSSMAFSKVYARWDDPGKNHFVPLYSRSQNLENSNLSSAVEYTLRGIPAYKHRVAESASSSTKKQEEVSIEITLLGGYSLPSKMDISEGTAANTPGIAKFSGNGQYGVEVAFGILKNMDFFIQYQRLEAVVRMNTPIWGEAGPLTINHNYFLLGAEYNFRVNKSVAPYAGISTGALNIVPQGADLRDYWYFILGARAGIKFYFSKWIGMKIQAEVLTQLHTSQAPLIFTDNPTGIPVDATSDMIQTGISGGIIFRIGNSGNK
jgi:hypothetical protein